MVNHAIPQEVTRLSQVLDLETSRVLDRLLIHRHDQEMFRSRDGDIHEVRPTIEELFPAWIGTVRHRENHNRLLRSLQRVNGADDHPGSSSGPKLMVDGALDG